MSDHEPLRIECRSCIHDGSSQCDDCVVSFLLDHEHGAVVVDAQEARALRSLGEAGLVPLLKLTPKPPPRRDSSEEAG
jgi:NSD-like protein with Cys-His rich domain